MTKSVHGLILETTDAIKGIASVSLHSHFKFNDGEAHDLNCHTLNLLKEGDSFPNGMSLSRYSVKHRSSGAIRWLTVMQCQNIVEIYVHKTKEENDATFGKFDAEWIKDCGKWWDTHAIDGMPVN